MYPRVTQVLSPWVDFSRVHPDVLAHAAERGTEVHKYCAALAKGLWLPEPPEEIRGYIESFKAWFKLVKRVILVEEELVDEIYGYMGHPDMVVEFNNKKVLIDLKTPISFSKTWPLQLAAYWRLCHINGIEVDEIAVLQLSPEGKPPKYTNFEKPYCYFSLFLSALNLWKFFNT